MFRGNVLAIADFRRLWLCGFAVSIARWLEMLVIGIVVWRETGSAFLVAGMTLLRLTPMGLFGAVLGVVGDRFERRLALLLVLLVQGSALLALGIIAAFGQPAVWQIALACLVGGIGWAADNPVRRMMLGDILGPARMGTGMSLEVVANNISRIIGPALGGTLLAAFGMAAAFAASIALYAVAIGMTLRVTHRGTPSRPRGGPVLAEVAESFRIAARIPALRGVMVVTVVFNMFGWPFTSMVPVIASEHLGLGPVGTGWLASMDGFGALIGASLIGLLARPEQYRLLFLGGAAAYLAMLTLFALSPGAVLAGLALLLLGFGNAGFSSMQATLVYMVTPPELRSRALGVLSVAVGTGLLGFFHLGVMASLIGAKWATVLIGMEGLLALALTRRYWRHQ